MRPKCWLVLVLLAPQLAAADAVDGSVGVLRQFDVEPNVKSIRTYLESFHPDEASIRRVNALIEQLGDASFRRREAAMNTLMALPFGSIDLIRKATKSDDYEAAYRAELILQSGEKHRSRLLKSVLTVVDTRNIAGLAAPILAIIPDCEQQYLIHAARRALKATCRAEDVQRLKQAIQSDNMQIQIAAIEALGFVAYEANRGVFDQLLTDDHDHIRLAAAWTLADRGERASLTVLTALLESDDYETRGQSVRILRGLTRNHFGFAPFDSPEKRAAAVAKWQAWLASDGKTADLRFPVEFSHHEVGRTLICLASKQKIVELDINGKQIWEKAGLNYPWRATGLSNGHRLVASYGGKYAVEYDADGNEVWRKDALPGGPHSIQRLDNGNTLMACSDSHKVVEITPDQETAWQIHIDGRPTDARRLPDGRTLIVLKNAGKIVEVDRAGKVLWEITGLNWPNTAERLENGNTLVAEVRANRVVEFDGAGEVMWEKDGIKQPYDAQRLSNGHTLISQNSLVSIVNRAGDVVWSKKTEGDTRATRY